MVDFYGSSDFVGDDADDLAPRQKPRARSADTVTLSIVVPVKDEEDAIAPFIARVAPILEKVATNEAGGDDWEILFVDDGSSDATLAAIMLAHRRDPRVRAISLSRNFGKEAALSAGLDLARGAAVVPMDVDMQDPPETLIKMMGLWREGYEVVYGVRLDRRDDSLVKRLTADLFYRAHNRLSNDRIPAHAGDFRLLDRAVVDVIRAMPERNRFMKGLFAWAGFRSACVEYRREARTVGRSKFNYWRLWTLAIDGITSASTAPLRVWSYVGVAIAIAGLLYAAILIIRTMAFGVDVPGYSSLMVTLLFFGGLQLISLGVLGEYVGRILVETKRRPLYVIRTRVGVAD